MTRMLAIAMLVLLAPACVDSPQPDVPTPEAYEEGPPLVTADGKGDDIAGGIPAYTPLGTADSLEMEFEALFAPDDPVHSVEMELIARVVQARGEDERAFAEGENPYRIRYAVYNLRNPRIVDALVDAERSGVDVQVLIEEHQLDPAKTWNTADETLIENGFEFVADHRDLTGDQFDTADLIGIDDSGLMHLKARIYETPSNRVVYSGSLNPGDNAMLNEETVHIIREDRVVQKYVAAYEAVLHDERLSNDWDDGAAVNVMFTPAGGDRAVERVFDWVAAEDEQILLMVFSLRDLRAPGHSESLVELLEDKVDEGVPVWVITDRKQSDGVDADGNQVWRDDSTEDRLRAAGVHVYEATNDASPFTAMHHKVAVLGKTDIRVITDAANWTFSGLGSDTRSARNIESQLFIDSAALDDNRTGRRYMAQWVRVASRYAHQSSGDGEPGFETIWDSLATAADWPAQDVSFVAHDGFTDFGQSVFVKGNVDVLGQWGAESDGHELATDEERFPTWASPGPAAMPVGQSFEYKFTIQFAGDPTVQWESGENRFGVGQPTALRPDVGARHEGTWR